MRFFARISAALLLVSLCSAAQSAPPIDRLPKDTTFFFAWNGAGSIDKARATNPLLRLWDDPEFAAVRRILIDRAARDAKSSGQTGIKDFKLLEQDLLNLAANPFVFGMIGMPDLNSSSARAGAPKAAANAYGFFLIYDLTGKAEQHKRVLTLLEQRATQKPIITKYSHAGVEVTKEVRQKKPAAGEEVGTAPRGESTTFTATVGSFYVSSDSQNVIERLITRLSGSGATESLASTVAYQSALAQRTPDAFFELFFKVPDLTKLDLPPAQGMNFAAMLKGLHLERMHAFSASASLAGNGTRFRAAAIGDTAPGSLFDLLGTSSGDFRTLALAPAGSSYNVTRIDLLSFYKTLRGAIQSGLNVEQASQFEMMEGLMGSQLGVGLAEALGALSGEVASISLDTDGNGGGASGNANGNGNGNGNDSSLPASLDPLRSMYAITIDRPDVVLKLVQLVAGRNLTSESREGDATILAVTLPYRDEKTGAQRKRFNYIGVTSNMMIVAPRKALLREAIARVSAQRGPANSGLAADPGFVQARNRLPNNLSALAYTDLSRMPWQFMLDSMIKEINKKESEKLTTQEEEAIRGLPRIFSRYLHTTFGGWWKDRNGVFGESFIE